MSIYSRCLSDAEIAGIYEISASSTNNPGTNTIVYVSGVAGITNASGYVTNLTVTLTTNTIKYQIR